MRIIIKNQSFSQPTRKPFHHHFFVLSRSLLLKMVGAHIRKHVMGLLIEPIKPVSEECRHLVYPMDERLRLVVQCVALLLDLLDLVDEVCEFLRLGAAGGFGLFLGVQFVDVVLKLDPTVGGLAAEVECWQVEDLSAFERGQHFWSVAALLNGLLLAVEQTEAAVDGLVLLHLGDDALGTQFFSLAGGTGLCIFPGVAAEDVCDLLLDGLLLLDGWGLIAAVEPRLLHEIHQLRTLSFQF